ncbi:hypothetical protein [Frankia sp. R43]|uniref:hypothetical protein n=1 Tax=Frankia sp. R43 TaxID=269536 RepID=UPI000ACE73A9|nr:hypothetical protein [Frankia sp. R43]
MTYDRTNEHRVLVTSLNVGAGSAPTTFTATYNAGGKLTSQTLSSVRFLAWTS